MAKVSIKRFIMRRQLFPLRKLAVYFPYKQQPRMSATGPKDTRSEDYTARLRGLQRVWWKRLLNVQAPYRRNIDRHLGGRRTLDVGCGIGRHLNHLTNESIGVDHNPDSVELCLAQGLRAYVPDEFFADDTLGKFDGLLCAHVLEHLASGTQAEILAPYLDRLASGGWVMVICPQERGYSSDSSHCDFVTGERIAHLLTDLGLHVTLNYSFPLPRAFGPYFTHNEFCVVARKP
jgi:SAM-dependent methyltransferase